MFERSPAAIADRDCPPPSRAPQAFSREDAAESAARVVKDLARSYNSYARDQVLANMLLSAVAAARPVFARAMEQEDDQLGGAISRASSEVAISYPEVFLMEGEQGQTELLLFIASFVSFPDPQVAQDAFPIWGELGWRARGQDKVPDAAVLRCQQVAHRFLQMLVPTLEMPAVRNPPFCRLPTTPWRECDGPLHPSVGRTRPRSRRRRGWTLPTFARRRTTS